MREHTVFHPLARMLTRGGSVADVRGELTYRRITDWRGVVSRTGARQ
jgi:hypothetical protein